MILAAVVMKIKFFEEELVRFAVFMVVTIHIVIFWVIARCNVVGDTKVSEECTAAIFRV
jgi:hypothetical protein